MAGLEDVQRAINAELARLGMTPGQLAREIGIDPGTLTDLLLGARKPKSPTQGKIERYFQWPAGTIAEVLAGRGTLPDVSATSDTPDGVLLDIDLSDLPERDRELVIAAARLKALEVAREVRRTMGE
ncbi:helix-turn-helix transcriptional regulator [Cellulomonas sp. C5510]|uniref:helix-turn-helix domain-containing protein n=1 Tax=Cellulomonas sp. C5510 TaxID=2871170 RepID=UPI001C9568DF|nr:helix-turn-helix transcriptional regulator [Cellulomonas sp. C5510]QZN86941.1 helix-turn-helix transcriptional regulator [Cellulomonas sp. C5510]